MFGTDYTVKGYAAPREMGEMTPPKKAPKECNEYRPREMGEYSVPSREKQQDYFEKANTTTPIATTQSEYRPREMGEYGEAARPAKREMTEQEKRLDLFA